MLLINFEIGLLRGRCLHSQYLQEFCFLLEGVEPFHPLPLQARNQSLICIFISQNQKISAYS